MWFSPLLKNSLWSPWTGDQKTRTGFQVLDFVIKTEIAFSACVIEKAPDGTFSTSS